MTVPSVDMEMINMNHQTLFNKEVQFPHLIQQVELKFVHPWVRNLYCAKILCRKLETADKLYGSFITRRGKQNIFSRDSSP